MILAIHQPQYMPWSGYFHKMASADRFVLLDNVQFKKNEWQHRNRIRGPNGAQWISVPTTYKFPQLINEVGIADEGQWRIKHLRSIEACYRKSPFFNDFFPKFEAFFARSFTMLSPCNIDSIRLLAECLGITTPIEIASSFSVEGSSTERLINICRRFGADTYLAGAGGRDYMNMNLFDAAGISVIFQEFDPPRYPQLWCREEGDFIPALSAIDLIFNCEGGANAVIMEGARP
ncbi:MAG: WbqC family protein [Chitinispirillaceae bacterium]|nr:WbqC family protein [Chitinispirillaceae bacterium]